MSEAERLRLACRWDDALAALAGRDDVEARMERVQVLADKNMLAEDVEDELERAIDALDGEAAGDTRIAAFVQTRRGLKLHAAFLQDRSQGEPPDEMVLFESALAIRRELGDEQDIAESLFHVGLVHQVVRGDHATAEPYFEESYDRARGVGDAMLMSYAVRHRGFARQAAGDLDAAEAELRESRELRRASGWAAGIAAAEAGVAQLLGERGRLDEAIELTEKARAILVEIGAVRVLGFADGQLAELRAAAEAS